MKSHIVIASMVFGAALAPMGTAAADDSKSFQDAGRRGLLLGFGLQGGHIRFECQDDPSCGDQLNEAFGLNLQVAYMMTNQLALSVDGWVMIHRGEFLTQEYTVTHSMLTIGPQVWLVPRIWLRGGLGWARLHVDAGFVEAESEDVFGIMGALGWEIVTSPRFALDVQLRGGTGFYDGGDAINAGLGLGFTWF